MELQYNRRMLLLNQDLPFSTYISPDIEPITTTTNNSSLTLSTPPRPIFSSNVAYALLILFTVLFFLGFIILYFRRHSSSHPSGKGVDPTVAAKSLPAFSYHGDEKEQKQVDCAICLEELREGEKVKKIVYCNHVFHQECIDAWLARHVTCPICRCNMRVGDEHGHGGESRVEEEGSRSRSPGEGRSSTTTVALRRTLGCCL